MLRLAGPSINDEVDEVVEGLLQEELDYDRTENRSAHREHLVRAVLIQIRDPEHELWSFSRNVSLTGIGLITQEEVNEGVVATLNIEKMDGGQEKILASCRWCSRYGQNWFMSGWQFINVR